MNAQELESTFESWFKLTSVPPLLDAKGVRQHVADIGRTLLYEAASSGEIQSVSLGMGKRGKRLFVTKSVVEWIGRCAEKTKQPKLGTTKECRASEE